MLEPRYQQMLKNAVDHTRIENQEYSKENPKLEQAIKQVKFECPNKFHFPQSLGERRFYDEPAAIKVSVPHSGFVKPLPKINRY